MNIVNVGYDSTNYYVIANGTTRLLVDVGMPGTLPKLQHRCKQMDIRLEEVDYLLCTHYHPDHAGIAENVKRLGVKLIVLEIQLTAIPALKKLVKPDAGYMDIDLKDSVILRVEDSRDFLARLHIQGEIISTPGHSDDCVTLVLDGRQAFTGDLVRPMFAEEIWKPIRALQAKTIYPGHGPVWQLDA
jgi:endoribonuclease LACTB2